MAQTQGKGRDLTEAWVTGGVIVSLFCESFLNSGRCELPSPGKRAGQGYFSLLPSAWTDFSEHHSTHGGGMSHLYQVLPHCALQVPFVLGHL